MSDSIRRAICWLLFCSSLNVVGQDVIGYDGSGCPNMCNVFAAPMHGRCDTSTPVSVCRCNSGYSGVDCGRRSCPTGPAWFDQATDASTAHTSIVECSGRGTCDTRKGVCKCAADFEGAACERGRCPTSSRYPGTECSGHGRCASMRQAGLTVTASHLYPVQYDGWDADRIFGCLCDDGWHGTSCEERVCPVGSDPLARGQCEVHAIQSNLQLQPGESQRETQRISVVGQGSSPQPGSGGPVDVDEVQRITLVAVGGMPRGSFTVGLDCREVTGGCLLWEQNRRAKRWTGSIELDEPANPGFPNASLVADSLRVALESFDIVGGVNGDQIAVSGEVTRLGTSYDFLVTFHGSRVPSDIPKLLLDHSGAYQPDGAACSGTVTEVINGSQIMGTVQLQWDDAMSTPSYSTFHTPVCNDTEDDAVLQPLGTRSVAFDVYSNTSTVADAVTALVFGCSFPLQHNNLLRSCVEAPPHNAVTVTRSYDGGPGFQWTIRFNHGIRARGDLAPITVGPLTSLTLQSTTFDITGAGVQVDVEEVNKGVFIGGYFSLLLPYNAADGSSAFSPPLGPFQWCSDAAVIVQQAEKMDFELALGQIAVTRHRVYPSDGNGGHISEERWMGEYEWMITFQGRTDPVPLLVVNSGFIGTGGQLSASATSRISTADGTCLGNEVQFIDCVCSSNDCYNNSRHGFRLTFKGSTTPFIPYSSTGDQLRQALASLPSIPDVMVRSYDSVSNTTASICDADGTSTGITFAWNPGPQPPLRITGDSLPPSAQLTVVTAPGLASYGGRRAKPGNRLQVTCSDRGSCVAASGTCQCYDSEYGLSDNGGYPDASPGNGNRTTVNGEQVPPSELSQNCGTPSVAITGCPGHTTTPGACNGRGACSGPPLWRCACIEGWSGPACETQNVSCHYGPQWFDVPTLSPVDQATVLAHQLALCSGHGTCTGGVCVCDGQWSGFACELSPCPGAQPPYPISVDAYTHATCSNGQPCVTMREYGRRYTRTPDTDDPVPDSGVDYSGWDADVIRGCACNAVSSYHGPAAESYYGYTGFDCSSKKCAAGADPQELAYGWAAAASVDQGGDPSPVPVGRNEIEVQRLACTLNAGKLRLRFKGLPTRYLAFDAYVLDDDVPVDFMGRLSLESALREINATRPVVVAFESYVPGTAGATAGTQTLRRLCEPNGTNVVLVSFPGITGDAPLLTAEPDAAALLGGGSVSIAEVTQGSLPPLECNRRGVCDANTGTCTCQPQFGSSDGLGGPGQMGDCGYRFPGIGLKAP